MTSIPGAARAVADLHEGRILASVEIASPPERVFEALTSKEIIDWWGLPGVFDTREWTGDICRGGRWRASGLVRGQPYVLEGEFLEVQPPIKLVHTWQRVDVPGALLVQPRCAYEVDNLNRLGVLVYDGVKPDFQVLSRLDCYESVVSVVVRIDYLDKSALRRHGGAPRGPARPPPAAAQRPRRAAPHPSRSRGGP